MIAAPPREGSAPRGPDAHDYWLARLRRQFDQRQMERQEETGDGRQHHGRSDPDGRLRDGGAAYIGFDAIFNRAVLEVVSQY
jgi:hypothetical protein